VRPVVVGCMLGEVAKDRLVRASGAKEGDALFLAGAIAIEGTALLAREAYETLRERGLSEEFLGRAQNFLFDPGISVVRAARRACEAAEIHAMHDPTEGGLATGIMEMAKGANLGIRVEARSIPVLPECEVICQTLGLDPLGLIASGSLLLAVAPPQLQDVQEALARETIPGACIGTFIEAGQGLQWLTEKGMEPFPTFARDEVARALDVGF